MTLFKKPFVYLQMLQKIIKEKQKKCLNLNYTRHFMSQSVAKAAFCEKHKTSAKHETGGGGGGDKKPVTSP